MPPCSGRANVWNDDTSPTVLERASGIVLTMSNSGVAGLTGVRTARTAIRIRLTAGYSFWRAVEWFDEWAKTCDPAGRQTILVYKAADRRDLVVVVCIRARS